MTECEEVAINMLPHAPDFSGSFNKATAWVTERMGADESHTIRDNIAEALVKMQESHT